MAQAAGKKVPVLGAAVGVGLGVWRFVKGEVIEGFAWIGSGLLGATGAGAIGSLAIDTGLIVTDIIK